MPIATYEPPPRTRDWPNQTSPSDRRGLFALSRNAVVPTLNIPVFRNLGPRSTMRQFLPPRANSRATVPPPGPVPTTMQSYRLRSVPIACDAIHLEYRKSHSRGAVRLIAEGQRAIRCFRAWSAPRHNRQSTDKRQVRSLDEAFSSSKDNNPP